MFHAYENSWSVYFEAGEVDENNLLLIALCRVWSTACASAAELYHLLDCVQLLSSVQVKQWHNAYITSQDELGTNTSLCDTIQSVPRAVQMSLENVLSYSAGGALVRRCGGQRRVSMLPMLRLHCCFLSE